MIQTAGDGHEDNAEAFPAEEASTEETLVSLILRAYAVVRPTILTARKLEGLSLMEARLMRRIQAGAGQTLEDVAPELLLGANASAELVKDMQKQGLISLGPNGELSLTKQGSERFSAVLQHTRMLETIDLADIPEGELRTTKRVLATLINRHAKTHASGD
jgi:hypothetical protein